MKTIILNFVILILFPFLVINSGCNGQNTQDKEITNANEFQNSEPKTDIKVNKEYDKDGNLVRYDSTYSYYYSNIKNDSLAEDSIYNEFKSHFNKNYFFSDDVFFDDIFFNDSLLMYDFYKDDFFLKRYKENRDKMDELFMQMDSVKNRFFDSQFEKP